MIQQHNEAERGFHLDLYAPVVIGHEFDAARDIVHINVSNPWWLLNAFRSINAGWVFQLNSDATFNFCCSQVDMIGFGHVWCEFSRRPQPSIVLVAYS